MTQRTKKSKPRLALVASFADAPDAKAMLAHYEVPAKLAKCGFYVVLGDQAEWLFDKHPETKLPAKTADAGLLLVTALLDEDQVRETLGRNYSIGFHANLDGRALATAFEAEGFTVKPAPISRLATIYGPSDPWPAVAKLVASGTDLSELLDSLHFRQPLTPPPERVLSSIAKQVETRDELASLLRVLRAAKSDLVASALPLVARCWKPRKAKAKPRRLPPELTTLLSAFDGIPGLVMSATELAERRQNLLRLAKGAKGVGKRDWGATPKEIRIDRFWRERWIPFCQRPDEEVLAIDLDPAAKGTRGQIIGVHLNPPTLRRYRATFGEWLWNELEQAWR